VTHQHFKFNIDDKAPEFRTADDELETLFQIRTLNAFTCLHWLLRCLAPGTRNIARDSSCPGRAMCVLRPRPPPTSVGGRRSAYSCRRSCIRLALSLA